jgi:SAM-dependent methyltransferase
MHNPDIDAVEKYCWRLIARQTIRLSERYIKGQILDIGAGYGFFLDELRHKGFGTGVGVDLAPDPDTSVIKGSADNLPFEDGCFDTVFLNNVFIHLRPEVLSEAVKEISRVIRGGGHVIITGAYIGFVKEVFQTFCPKCDHSFNAYYAFRNHDVDTIYKDFQGFRPVTNMIYRPRGKALFFLWKRFPRIHSKIIIKSMSFLITLFVKSRNICVVLEKL